MKQKKQKKKSKVYSKKGLSRLIQKYSSLDTKQNVGNTAIKSITEVAAGAGLGSLLSTSLGKNSPLAGLLLVFAGNYVGDSTHLLKTIGIGTIAHGIAKANDYDKMGDAKSRFQQLREDWKKTLRIPTKEKKSVVKNSTETPTPTSLN